MIGLCRRELDARALLDLGAERIEPAVLDRVFEPRVLAVRAVAPVALHGDHRLGDLHRIFGAAEAHDVGGARIGVGLAVGHAHAAADGHVPAGDVAGLVRDRDEAEVVREDVDVVRRRHRDHDLEFARQVGLAVDRLHHLLLAARDALAVEPDLAIGRRVRQQMIGDRARQRERFRMRARLLRQHDCT